MQMQKFGIIDCRTSAKKRNLERKSRHTLIFAVNCILGHIWTSEHPRMRARIELLLKQLKLTRKDVKDILQSHHHAARGEYENVVSLLLAHGASPTTTNIDVKLKCWEF